MTTSARLQNLTSWHSEWAGLRAAVLGLGVTGFSVADTLVELGSEVFVLAAGAGAKRTQLLEVIGARFLEHPLTSVPAELASFDPELIDRKSVV